jgi:hypothetical protein
MRACAITAVLVLVASPVMADHIGLYDDAFGNLCVAPLAFPPTPNVVYVINKNGTGAQASKWRIAHELTLIELSFNLTNPYLAIVPMGSPLSTGTTVSYLDCRLPPYVIGYVSFMYFGGAVGGCDHLRVEAHQGDEFYGAEETPVVVDCADVTQSASGGKFSFGFPGQFCDTCLPLPVHSTTWGTIKALYR